MTWEELYITYSDRVHRYIYILTGNNEVAEDLTHDTFIRVEKAIMRFRGDSQKYTWLISIARHVTYDYLKRRKRIRFIPLRTSFIDISYEMPDDIVQKGETTTTLYKAIKSLKLSYQEVLLLRKIEELSIEETATVLGWSISKVKSTTSRAMKALEKALKMEGGHHNV